MYVISWVSCGISGDVVCGATCFCCVAQAPRLSDFFKPIVSASRRVMEWLGRNGEWHALPDAVSQVADRGWRRFEKTVAVRLVFECETQEMVCGAWRTSVRVAQGTSADLAGPSQPVPEKDVVVEVVTGSVKPCAGACQGDAAPMFEKTKTSLQAEGAQAHTL